MELGVRQEAAAEGDGDPTSSQRSSVNWLDGVVVLRTMIERWVLPLKHRATLLCDYPGAKDPTHESSEALDITEVEKQVGAFIPSAVMVAAECIVEAFSLTYRPNLVSHPGSFSFHCSEVVG
jgi:hypothetical protein